MLTLATQLVVDGVEPQKAMRLLKEFNETAIGVYEGQQYDMEFEARTDVTIDEYMEMIRLKTSVLLAGAARIGAVMGDADERNANALYDFAVNLGLAFQLADDLLDVVGSSRNTGKPVGGDIREGKRTVLLADALSAADTADKADLIAIFEEDCRNDNQVARTIELFTSTGALDRSRERIAALWGESRKAIAGLELNSEAQRRLTEACARFVPESLR